MSIGWLVPEQDITGSIVRALVLYSLAEFQGGHCQAIRVEANEGIFRVADDGRGHAIERTVGKSPYLKFIYTHLDYPFLPPRDAPVQLQGIGLSLINVLCSEVAVLVRKPNATLRLSFQNGCWRDEEQLNASSGSTGTEISGTVAAHLSRGFDVQALEEWLRRIKVSAPSLGLQFNGREVHVQSQSNA